MSSEVGSGQVAIFPVFKGFRQTVGLEVDKSAKDAGQGFTKVLGKTGAIVGKTTGRGFKQAFDSSTSNVGEAAAKKIKAEIASTSKAISASRLKEQDAAGKVRVAEAALAEARKKGVAGSARVVAAEERLATASRGLDAAQDNTRKSSEQLKDAQRRLADQTVQSNEKAAKSTRLLLSSSLRRGANLGASAGLNLGRGFLGSFKKAIGPIAGVLAGYIGFAALSSGFRKFTGFIRDSVTAIGEWQVLNAQSRATVLATGGAARVSSRHINKLSLAIEEQTATQAEQIQEGANLILNFKNIRNAAGKNNKIYDLTVRASVDMARALGKDVPGAASILARALNSPADGLKKLAKSGVTFTDQQKDQVKAMVAAGDVLGAQKLIIAEVNKTFGESGEAFAKTLPGKIAIYKDALGDVGETIATGITPSLGKFLDFATNGFNKLNESPFLAGLVARMSGVLDNITAKSGKLFGIFERLSSTSEGITFAGVKTALAEAFPQLQPLLGVVDKLAPLLPQLTDGFVKLAPPISDLLLAVVPLIPPLVGLVQDVVPGLVSVVTALTPALTGVIDGVAGFAELSTMLFGVLSGDTTLDEFGQKMTTVRGIYGQIMTVVGQVGGAIGTALANGGKAVTKFSTGVGTNVGKVISFFRSIPGKISDAISGLGATLFASGGRIIERFAAGIRGAIGSVTSSVGDVINRVRDFLPHSPAKVGPFSGSGWRQLKSSGGAVMTQFGAGFDARAVDVSAGLERTLRTAVRAPRLVKSRGAASTGPASRRDSVRPITLNGESVGWFRELASGEAEIVFRREGKKQTTGRDMGFRRDS